jgi:diadenosine tetraphosphatase ApaH/serine/threonine PP2A family protein phosphatase
VFTQSLNFFSPDELGYQYRLTEDKTLINVGSVGQPRDGDPRACYVVLENNVVHFRRLEYPIDVTVKKIYDIPELDNFLGDRLREGR